ncbi:SRPBCC family protein [Cohnella nanjingensis]|uniref:SRPBCC family protein n=1 Tax=Cohnella nanjingensis TaxID=1387779 RepID=A0A7X0VGQ9_9BACL|nr:SRPBCC family protein [Cohnella nanjingensis]MBB6673357.1 SRPBCC family protein [Cohnella nanjingensis]
MNNSTFAYVTYIATTPEKLWEALTNGDFTEKYWFGRKVQSDWTEGAPVTFRIADGTVAAQGVVLESEPYRRLSYTFQWPEDRTVRERSTKVTFELQPMEAAVKLSLKHEDLLPTDIRSEHEGFNGINGDGINNGWPVILSGLKSLLESGKPLSLRTNPTIE